MLVCLACECGSSWTVVVVVVVVVKMVWRMKIYSHLWSRLSNRNLYFTQNLITAYTERTTLFLFFFLVFFGSFSVSSVLNKIWWSMWLTLNAHFCKEDGSILILSKLYAYTSDIQRISLYISCIFRFAQDVKTKRGENRARTQTRNNGQKHQECHM